MKMNVVGGGQQLFSDCMHVRQCSVAMIKKKKNFACVDTNECETKADATAHRDRIKSTENDANIIIIRYEIFHARPKMNHIHTHIAHFYS